QFSPPEQRPGEGEARAGIAETDRQDSPCGHLVALVLPELLLDPPEKRGRARPAQNAGRPQDPSTGLGVAALAIEGTQESLPGTVEGTRVQQPLPQLGVKERDAGIQRGRELQFHAGPSQPLRVGLAGQLLTKRSVVDSALRVLLDGRLKPPDGFIAAKR